MTLSHAVLVALLSSSSVLALACSAPDPSAAGVETGPCVQGECFDGLSCLSNLCVGQDETGGTGVGAQDEGGPGGGGSPGGDGNGPSGDGTPGSDTSPGSDGNPDPDSGDAESDTGDATVGLDGCEAIDFLFVIDNSGSMGQEQARLLAALPGFVSDVQGRLGTRSPHFMVADVDGWPYQICQDACDPPPACLDANGACNIFGPGDCQAICTGGLTCGTAVTCGAPIPHAACDEVLGAGVRRTFGTDSSDQECAFRSGGRYIDASEPDLLDALDCAMRVGTGSFANPELPMEALVEAVRTDGEVGGCNEGFLRDGAMLVVVFITDEDDAAGDSAGNPAAWHTALLGAKGGDPNAVVVLGLFGDGDQPFSQCNALPPENGAETSQRLRAFMQLLGDNGVFGSVCAPNYEDSFGQLVDVVQGICAVG